jgi:3',5'-cyclic AMP phosphodiesterase CpdA
MRIAHFSDLHLLALDGVAASRFLNKRLTGWMNLRFKRSHVHRAEYVRAIAREVARLRVEHVVVTGDLTNLALEGEFELARDLLERDLGLDPAHVTIVPGNHDLYTRGAMRTRRFERYLAPYLQGDLPELAVDAGGGSFPVVKLRGDVAVVAVSSAVPQPPLVAAGELGRAQLEALGRVVQHPEVKRRLLVLALHHPAVHQWSRLKTHIEGLRDAQALLALLQPVKSGLLLHGHLHRRIQRMLRTEAGGMHHVGATSASLHHEEPDRMAGFNVYDVSAAGVTRVEAVVFDPRAGTFRVDSVPKHV